MKKEDLIIAAEDLNDLLFDEDDKDNGWIYVDDTVDIMKAEIRKSALWLLADDELKDATIKVLKAMKYTDEDFESLKEAQKPRPAFLHHGIITEEKPKPKRQPRAKPKTQKKKEESVVEPTPEAEPAEEPKEEAQEYVDEAPPKKKGHKKSDGPSAYGTAIALMGPDPTLPLSDLYVMMKEQGFDLQIASGSIKTAHSMVKKCYIMFDKYGHIKK